MPETYVLWSPRLQGWFTNGGTFASDLAHAKRFPRDAAFATARARVADGFNEFGLLPVILSDLESLRDKR